MILTMLLLLTDQKDSVNSGSFSSEPMPLRYLLLIMMIPFLFLVMVKLLNKKGYLISRIKMYKVDLFGFSG